MVVSGINIGANMGDDTVYSGTVAAATEGYLLGIPSLAVSLCSKAAAHFETAARVALELVQLIEQRCASPCCSTSTSPISPTTRCGDGSSTRAGKRHKAEAGGACDDAAQRNRLLGRRRRERRRDAGEGTDFFAVANDQVSITPLQIDLTHNAQLPLIRDWLAQ